MQLAVMVLQHWPATQALPAQQTWVLLPHPPQLPPKHLALFAQVFPAATQPVGSQQPPPVQTLLAQHAVPLAPQAWQLPPLPQTVFACEHCKAAA